jgi:hypothetical protein
MNGIVENPEYYKYWGLDYPPEGDIPSLTGCSEPIMPARAPHERGGSDNKWRALPREPRWYDYVYTGFLIAAEILWIITKAILVVVSVLILLVSGINVCSGRR